MLFLGRGGGFGCGGKGADGGRLYSEGSRKDGRAQSAGCPGLGHLPDYRVLVGRAQGPVSAEFAKKWGVGGQFGSQEHQFETFFDIWRRALEGVCRFV